MQPCPTCGGMGIDANGYCTNCRTYRGIPQFGGSPVSAAPYSGRPADAGPPVSGQPYPQPVSPAYPGTTYGGAYGPPPGPPPRKRNAFVTPVLALSGVLVVIVVAIVIVVVVKNNNNSTGGTANGAGTGTAAADSKIDKCVVGSWVMTSYSEDVPIDQVGNVPFTLSGQGAAFTFGAGGKSVEDFRSGTVFKGNVTQAGTTIPVTLTVSGTVSADVGTNNGAMSFANLKSTAKAVVSAAGQKQTKPFNGDNNPANYTCAGDKLTLSTSTYREELKRS